MLVSLPKGQEDCATTGTTRAVQFLAPQALQDTALIPCCVLPTPSELLASVLVTTRGKGTLCTKQGRNPTLLPGHVNMHTMCCAVLYMRLVHVATSTSIKLTKGLVQSSDSVLSVIKEYHDIFMLQPARTTPISLV